MDVFAHKNKKGQVRPYQAKAMKFNRHIRCCLMFLLPLLLISCVSNLEPYIGYSGPELGTDQVAVVRGEVSLRKDWLNTYVDVVRFSALNGEEIDLARNYDTVVLTPGEHVLDVYYAWDMGSRTGLATALVRYAAEHESMSQTLQLDVQAGESYLVKSERVYDGPGRDVTSLTHVNFWVEDSDGDIVVEKVDSRRDRRPFPETARQ